MDFPLNSITGITFDRLADRVNVNFPNSTIGEDTDGNIVIYLNHYLRGDVLCAFPDEEEND